MLGAIQAAITATVAAAELIGALVVLSVVLINFIRHIKRLIKGLGGK